MAKSQYLDLTGLTTYDEEIKSHISNIASGKSDTGHTHNYAGSSSAGGAATSANKLNTNAGTATNPVYFANGIPVKTTYTLGKSVPSDAKFTDTTYSTGTESTSGITKLYTGTGTATDGTMTQSAITDSLNSHPLVTTAGTGEAYTATVSGITSLTAGVNFFMMPHTGSTTTSPTLNVNGLGAKSLRVQLSNSTSTAVAAAQSNFLGANKPVRVVYNGIFWAAQIIRPDANTIYGKIPITSGGTGADTAEQARINLGIDTSDGTRTSANADYAEIGEWADGNPDDEDRIGYFVAIDEDTSGVTMVKATSTSDVRGVTVMSPAFSGNCSSDKFEITTTTETDDVTGGTTTNITSTKLLKQYDYVAVMGIVPIIDNGTCTVNGRCMPADDGTAIPSSNNMGYQVFSRIDDDHVLIAVEPSADMLSRIKTDIGSIENEINEKTSDIPISVISGLDEALSDINATTDALTREINDISQISTKSLINQNYAKIDTSNGLTLGKIGGDVSIYIDENNSQIIFASNGSPIATMVYDKNTSASFTKMPTAKIEKCLLRSSNDGGNLGVVAQSNGHVSLKEVN